LGIERLRSFLRSRSAVALDTSILIYQIEKNPRYFLFSDTVFVWLETSGHSAITSTLSMTELLVPAHRYHDARRLQQYRGLLSTYPRLSWVAPDLEIADTAARMRAEYGLKTPDAIHAATAIQAKVSAFLTNDSIFQRITEFDTLVLNDTL
jgi:predicted nucleic acid-binding protein